MLSAPEIYLSMFQYKVNHFLIHSLPLSISTFISNPNIYVLKIYIPRSPALNHHHHHFRPCWLMIKLNVRFLWKLEDIWRNSELNAYKTGQDE